MIFLRLDARRNNPRGAYYPMSLIEKQPRSLAGASPEATFEMRRDDLKPEVRTYADNLHAQIAATLEELGINAIEELTEAARSGIVTPPQLQHLQEKIATLAQVVERDKIPSLELEDKLKLREQYESQKKILIDVGILEQLSSGKSGIKGIDGKEYPLPTYEGILERMEKKHEMLMQKAEQGFNQLLLVPFGMSLNTLIERYKARLLIHHQQGKLLGTKRELTEPDEQLALDTAQPVGMWSGYQQADAEGKLVYYPKEFSEQHGGKTKAEVIKEQSGWSILLIEDLPNIPREGQAKTIGGRPQLDTVGSSMRSYMSAGETVPSPSEYLAALQDDQNVYRFEEGMTPEGQLMYALKQLEETNQVVDDYQGNGRVSYQIASYFPASGYVPYFCWVRGDRRADLGGFGPDRRFGHCGVRSAVRV